MNCIFFFFLKVSQFCAESQTFALTLAVNITVSGEPSTCEHLLRLCQKDEEHRLVLLPADAEPSGPFYRPHGGFRPRDKL